MSLISPDDIRSDFSLAMSAMYRDEVPAYGTSMSLVANVNDATLAADRNLKDATDTLDRISQERHGAIRLGTPEELYMMRRVFAVMGMYLSVITICPPPVFPFIPRRSGRLAKRASITIRFSFSPRCFALI